MICDEDHVGVQFMPHRVFRAPAEWGDLAGELIVAGRPETSFEKPADLSGALTMGLWRVEDGGTRELMPVEPPVGQLSGTFPAFVKALPRQASARSGVSGSVAGRARRILLIRRKWLTDPFPMTPASCGSTRWGRRMCSRTSCNRVRLP
jgi:hypothetical protein